MSYASVAGIEWVVLTDGDEYRLYNSHATVPIEEKLFRSVRISDDVKAASESLGLFSKNRIRDNEINILWNAHFVDRQVRAVIEQFFATEPDADQYLCFFMLCRFLAAYLSKTKRKKE